MTRLRRLSTTARTAVALGVRNVARVAAYRAGLKLGIHPALRISGAKSAGPFFIFPKRGQQPLPPAPRRERTLFGWLPVGTYTDPPPDWHSNPLTGGRVERASRPWWEIPDFDPAVGDIKAVWECSRLDWVIAFAQLGMHGDRSAHERMNVWLDDWAEKNPPYLGPNWKCGQEASIRVMHLAMAALISGDADEPPQGLLDLVELHLRRIAPTVQYAIGQDNNHGTSEAAALFIGGGLLGARRPEGLKWEEMGRRRLEERIVRLVTPDGSFSQHSVNYHRVALDTLSMAELWRRRTGRPEFSKLLRQRAAAATRWLRAMVDPVSGGAPNLGNNDGALLLPLTDSEYRDLRPSVQLATALFESARAYGEGIWNEGLGWMGVSIPDRFADAPRSALFGDGGYAVLREGNAFALLRYPRFHLFRPSHADALHVDLWVNGENYLRDGGTFSYRTEAETFSGTASHNTIEFDGRDQMPRLGRFLFGDWLPTGEVAPPAPSDGGVEASASYRDSFGAEHSRRIILRPSSLIVHDSVNGFSERAVLRWRLRPGSWMRNGDHVTDGQISIGVESDVPIVRFELVEGGEAIHYSQKSAVPVLEVEIARKGRLTTRCSWT